MAVLMELLRTSCGQTTLVMFGVTSVGVFSLFWLRFATDVYNHQAVKHEQRFDKAVELDGQFRRYDAIGESVCFDFGP
ncbi:hypothetical protein BDV18DRAFT_137749 [Aspergillus unguis]